MDRRTVARSTMNDNTSTYWFWLSNGLVTMLGVVCGVVLKKLHREIQDHIDASERLPLPLIEKELSAAHEEIMLLRERTHDLSNSVQELRGRLELSHKR